MAAFSVDTTVMGTDFLDKWLYDLTNIKFKSKIVWPNVLVFLLLHIGGMYGCYVSLTRAALFTWWYGFFIFLGVGAGVTIAAHRFYTHRSFKATFAMRCFMMFWFTVAGQNSMYVWARDHRQHHKYTDTDADPHNSNRGFFFSHVGWLMMKKLPEVIENGKSVDMSDHVADPVAVFQKKYYYVLYALSNAFVVYIPCLWGESLAVSFWGILVFRSILVYNFTWSVNSAAHLFGTRPYNGKILPAENNLVSAVTFGEGWHNYHHTFPYDYKASEFGAKHDLSTRMINVFAKWGFISDLRETPQHLVNHWATKFGDGSHFLAWEDDGEGQTEAVQTKDDDKQQTEAVYTKEEVVPEKDNIIPDTCKETMDCFSVRRLHTAIA